MPPYLLRLAYVSEFFLALIAVLTGWSEIGGQGHLDIMPWYDILVLSVSLSLVAVLGTAAAVKHEKAFNSKTVTCLIAALLIAGAMGAVTYYYHLHEDDDNGESSSGSQAMLCHRPPREAV